MSEATVIDKDEVGYKLSTSSFAHTLQKLNLLGNKIEVGHKLFENYARKKASTTPGTVSLDVLFENIPVKFAMDNADIDATEGKTFSLEKELADEEKVLLLELLTGLDWEVARLLEYPGETYLSMFMSVLELKPVEITVGIMTWDGEAGEWVRDTGLTIPKDSSHAQTLTDFFNGNLEDDSGTLVQEASITHNLMGLVPHNISIFNGDEDEPSIRVNSLEPIVSPEWFDESIKFNVNYEEKFPKETEIHGDGGEVTTVVNVERVTVKADIPTLKVEE